MRHDSESQPQRWLWAKSQQMLLPVLSSSWLPIMDLLPNCETMTDGQRVSEAAQDSFSKLFLWMKNYYVLMSQFDKVIILHLWTRGYLVGFLAWHCRHARMLIVQPIIGLQITAQGRILNSFFPKIFAIWHFCNRGSRWPRNGWRKYDFIQKI